MLRCLTLLLRGQSILATAIPKSTINGAGCNDSQQFECEMPATRDEASALVGLRL